MFTRLAIDDGRHLPQLTLLEAASRAAGAARYQAACSCGRMPTSEPAEQEQALSAHLTHAIRFVGPSRGPAWLGLGTRVTLLMLGCLLLLASSLVAGQVLVSTLHLTGTARALVSAGAVLLGFVESAVLAVAARRLISN